jgi:hypothetical protein
MQPKSMGDIMSTKDKEEINAKPLTNFDRQRLELQRKVQILEE